MKIKELEKIKRELEQYDIAIDFEPKVAKKSITLREILTTYYLTYKKYLTKYKKKDSPEVRSEWNSVIDKQLAMTDNMFCEGVVQVLGARGYGKSEGALAKMTHMIYERPELTFLIVAKTATRANDLLKKVAKTLISLGVSLPENNATSIRTAENESKDPTISSLGANASGFRGKHPNYILIDDIITIESTSEADRIRADSVYGECISLSGNITLLGQYVHELDLYTRLEGLGVKTDKYFNGYLSPLDKTLEELRSSGLSDRVIYANYFGRLLPSDNEPFSSINKKDFYFNPENTTTATLDLAFGGGDKLGLSIGRVSKDNKIYVKCFGIKSSIYDEYDRIIALLKENNTSHLIVEANKTFKNVFLEFKKRLEPLGIKVSVYASKKGKADRIEEYVSYYHRRLVLFDNIDVNDVLYWSRKAKSDDIIDSLAMLCYYFKAKNL